MRPSRASRSRIWELIAWRTFVAGCHHPGVLAFLGREPEPARSDGAGDVVGVHLGDVGTELLEGRGDLAPEARLDGLPSGPGSRWRMISSMVAVFMPACWSWAKGFPASTASSCFASPTSTRRGMRSAAAITEQVAGLDGGGERALVDHQDGFREGRAQRPSAPPGLRQPPFGDAGIAGEEALQGLAAAMPASAASVFGRRGGRARGPDHAVAALLRENPGAVQHGRLAGSGIALDADHAILGREDQLDGLLLSSGERPPVEMGAHHASFA